MFNLLFYGKHVQKYLDQHTESMTVIIKDNDSCQSDGSAVAENVCRSCFQVIPYKPGIFSLFDQNPGASPVYFLSGYGKQLCPLP
jgi:hypothetical protein